MPSQRFFYGYFRAIERAVYKHYGRQSQSCGGGSLRALNAALKISRAVTQSSGSTWLEGSSSTGGTFAEPHLFSTAKKIHNSCKWCSVVHELGDSYFVEAMTGH